MARLTMVGAVLTVVLVAMTGCGGSKKTSSEASPPAATTSTTSTTSTSTTTTTTSSDNGGSSGSGTSSSSGNGSVSAKCIEFAGFASKFSQAFQGTGNAATDSQKLKSYFDALADKAPSDIKSAFRTFADAFAKYFDAIKSIDVKPGKTPSADDLAKLASAAKELDKPDVKAASNRIQAWVQGGCK
jgi:hypothetical protein